MSCRHHRREKNRKLGEKEAEPSVYWQPEEREREKQIAEREEKKEKRKIEEEYYLFN